MRWTVAAAALPVVALCVVARAAEDVAVLRGKFDAAVSAGNDADSQAAGKHLLAEHPDDPMCLYVLRTFLAKSWKWPRLKTSFAVLRRWEQDEIDSAKEPDFRIALIDALEDVHAKEDLVSGGGTIYEKAWTNLQAKRFDEAVRLGREYVRRFPQGGSADKARIAIAQALIAKSPPDVAAARKILEALAADERSSRRDAAIQLLDQMNAGARWIDVADGCPKAAGLGRVLLLTDLAEGDDFWKALAPWREARKADVVRFRPGKLKEKADELRKIGPEFVAIAARPAEIDVNFHWEVVELCRDLDGDPMPDFDFGYLVARDAADLRALCDRSIAAKASEAPAMSMVGVPRTADDVKSLDAILHYGHGQPHRVDGGIDAAALGMASLPRAPLVVSGACFNGVVGRSWHPCTMQPSFCRPVEIEPKDALCLAWIHAGATGVVAAMEADRGEMAGAEWAYLRETACAAGAMPGLSYRLAMSSLPETWQTMPRHRAGDARSLALFDVMLRGQLSRALIGDPTVRLLAKPLDDESVRGTARIDETGRVVVEMTPTERVLAGTEAQFLVVNTLTRSGMSGNGFTERRLWARVEVPRDISGRLGPPEIRAEREGAAVATLRTSVRHEVWGGKRFVCVQVESADGALVARGARAVFAFPVGK